MKNKQRKADIFVPASLPPPYNGQNIGTSLMINILRENYEVHVFRWNISWYLTDNAKISDKLKYYISAFFNYFRVILLVWIKFLMHNPSKMYIVPSSNLKGFLRDIFLYLPFLLFGKEIVCHIRSGSFSIKTQPFNWLYSKENFKFIFLTNILKRSSGVKVNSTVIPNFIDPAFEKFTRITKSASTIQLLYLSNLFTSKGIFDLVKAFNDLPDNNLFNLIICGKGEDSTVERLKREIGFNKNITFKGEIADRDFIRELYASSDYFVLPTTYNVEASPRTIIEAMSQGCVPIVTNHAGIPDMVNESCSYMIDKTKNIASQLSEVFDEILKNQNKSFIKKKNARSRYEQIYSYQTIKAKILEYFEKI